MIAGSFLKVGLTSMDRLCAATILSTVGQARKDGALGAGVLLQARPAISQSLFIVDIGGK